MSTFTRKVWRRFKEVGKFVGSVAQHMYMKVTKKGTSLASDGVIQGQWMSETGEPTNRVKEKMYILYLIDFGPNYGRVF